MKVLQFKREQAETEGARRATAGSACSERSKIPDPEVAEKARRRRFTAEYKIRILREADACRGDGDIGALLRREGLYSSNLTAWRKQRDAIAKEGLKACKRGRKAKQIDPRIKELERENTRLRRRLKKTETIIDFQKKASELLGISMKSLDSEEND